MSKPLCVDLFSGLGGWAEGFLAEDWLIIGFDIEPQQDYPGELVIQDVATLDGAQCRAADVIVASPPCQAYSYAKMPWKAARAVPPNPKPDWWLKSESKMTLPELRQWQWWQREFPAPPPDNSLFNHCFRIRDEASEAAGRRIPLIVENVCGAQKWVGRALHPIHYGSYYLWGDVHRVGDRLYFGEDRSNGLPIPKAKKFKGMGKDGEKDSAQRRIGLGNWRERLLEGVENPGADTFHKDGKPCPRLTTPYIKNDGGSWFALAHNTTSGKGQNPDGRKSTTSSAPRQWRDRERPRMNEDPAAVKVGGGWFGRGDDQSLMRQFNSRSAARKHASAMIAKIPLPLARHIAQVLKPRIEPKVDRKVLLS